MLDPNPTGLKVEATRDLDGLMTTSHYRVLAGDHGTIVGSGPRGAVIQWRWRHQNPVFVQAHHATLDGLRVVPVPETPVGPSRPEKPKPDGFNATVVKRLSDGIGDRQGNIMIAIDHNGGTFCRTGKPHLTDEFKLAARPGLRCKVAVDPIHGHAVVAFDQSGASPRAIPDPKAIPEPVATASCLKTPVNTIVDVTGQVEDLWLSHDHSRWLFRIEGHPVHVSMAHDALPEVIRSRHRSNPRQRYSMTVVKDPHGIITRILSATPEPPQEPARQATPEPKPSLYQVEVNGRLEGIVNGRCTILMEGAIMWDLVYFPVAEVPDVVLNSLKGQVFAFKVEFKGNWSITRILSATPLPPKPIRDQEAVVRKAREKLDRIKIRHTFGLETPWEVWRAEKFLHQFEAKLAELKGR